MVNTELSTDYEHAEQASMHGNNYNHTSCLASFIVISSDRLWFLVILSVSGFSGWKGIMNVFQFWNNFGSYIPHDYIHFNMNTWLTSRSTSLVTIFIFSNGLCAITSQFLNQSKILVTNERRAGSSLKSTSVRFWKRYHGILKNDSNRKTLIVHNIIILY